MFDGSGGVLCALSESEFKGDILTWLFLRTHRSFGSTREARRDSKMANSESLPFLVGDGAKKDENGGILKVTIDSGGSPKQSKRERRMRKTLDPGSVKFDVGFTVDEIKKSSTKREERRTAAKEKREAMLEAQREAVLGR